SIQILNMLKLAIITDDSSMSDKAVKSLELFYPDLDKVPFSSPQMLFALYYHMKSPKEIIISGDKNNKEFKELLKTINSKYIPNRILLYADDSIGKISPFIKNITQGGADNKVYICENYQCELPISDPERLWDALSNLEISIPEDKKNSEDQNDF